MSITPLEINQIIGQSSEVAKNKKRQLDKKKLIEIEEEKHMTQDEDKVLISQVNKKDSEIGLYKKEYPTPTHHPKRKDNTDISEAKKIIREKYKGNFLDISE